MSEETRHQYVVTFVRSSPFIWAKDPDNVWHITMKTYASSATTLCESQTQTRSIQFMTLKDSELAVLTKDGTLCTTCRTCKPPLEYAYPVAESALEALGQVTNEHMGVTIVSLTIMHPVSA